MKAPREHLLGITVALVLLLVAAFDWWVRGWFFDAYIMPRFGPGSSLIRERTNGRNPAILFDATRRTDSPALRIAFVGDSTMKAIPGADATIVPYLVRDEIRARLGHAAVDTIDGSVVGLFAADALLFIDKLRDGRRHHRVRSVVARPSQPAGEPLDDERGSPARRG